MPLRFRKEYYQSGPRTDGSVETSLDEGKSSWELLFNDPGQCPDMALTEQGVEQMFRLGQRLRKRYHSLFSPTFKPSEYFVRSTDITRTIMTAQAVMLGFAPDSYRPYETGVNWIDEGVAQLEIKAAGQDVGTDDPVVPHSHFAIPIHIQPLAVETMFPSYTACPRWAQERAKLRRPFRELDTAMHQKLRADLKECIGSAISTRRGWQSAANVLTPTVGMLPTHLCKQYRTSSPHSYAFCQQADEEHESVLPPCFTAEMFEGLQAAAGLELAFKFQSPQLCRLAIGAFVAELYADLKIAVENEDRARKLSLYSGHDSTLAPLLAAWNVFDRVLPPLGSYLIIELYRHKHTREKHIRMLYNDRVLALPDVVKQRTGANSSQLIPGLVSWQSFSQLTELVASTNRAAECARIDE